MDSNDILRALKDRDLNFTAVAEALSPKVTPQHVAAVASRKATNRRVALALAAAIERPIEEVFPGMGYETPRKTARKAAVSLLKQRLRACAA